jgi:hypothetical protein
MGGKWREGIDAKMAGRRVRRNGGKRVKIMAGRSLELEVHLHSSMMIDDSFPFSISLN